MPSLTGARTDYHVMSSNGAGCKLIAARPIVLLAIDPLQLPLAVGDCALCVLCARAVGCEHVDHEEVGDCGCSLLAGRADAGSGKRALASLAEHPVLRIRRPHG